jgi:hypothetical protein
VETLAASDFCVMQRDKLAKTKRDDNKHAESREKLVARLITMLALYLTPVLLLLIILGQWIASPSGGSSRWISIGTIRIVSAEVLREHFAAVVGLPMAAIFALWIVTILRSQSGPIEFEVFSFRFRGASGPVVLWVLCFLAIAFAIKLLW